MSLAFAGYCVQLCYFIKSLPASLSLIPFEYGIALHPILQASNKDIKQHQSKYQPLKMTKIILFFLTQMLQYPTSGHTVAVVGLQDENKDTDCKHIIS